MAKYRKKPVVIDAVQFTMDTKDKVFSFITCNKAAVFDVGGQPVILIETLEGEHRATLGDWIIKGVKNEFYPCKNDVFELTYERVEEKTNG